LTNAVTKLLQEGKDSLLSVCPNHRFLWRDDGRDFYPLNYDYRLRPMRQQMQNQYVENGSIYIFKPDILRRHGNRLGGEIVYHVMQSWQSFEIDDLDDFMLCEWLYKRYLSEPVVKRSAGIPQQSNTEN
jgi:N-acylneuraminate cytidylyltransferase